MEYWWAFKNVSRSIQIHQTSKEYIHNHLGLKNPKKKLFYYTRYCKLAW